MSNGIQRKLDIVEKKINTPDSDNQQVIENVSSSAPTSTLTLQKYKENVGKILLRSTLKNRQRKIKNQNTKITKLNAEIENLINSNDKHSLDIEVKDSELKAQKRSIENLEGDLYNLKKMKEEISSELETKKLAYKENSKFIENIEGQIRVLQQKNGQIRLELSGQEKAKAWQQDHFKKCENEKQELEDKNKVVNEQLSEIISVVELKQLEIKEIEELISEEKLKLEGHEAFYKQQEEKLDEVKTLKKSTLNTKQELIEKNVSLESKIKEIEGVIASTQDEISIAEGNILDLQEKYEEVISEETELQTNLNFLKEQFEIVCNERQKINHELQTAENKFLKTQKKYEKLTNTTREMEEELRVLDKKRENLRQDQSEVEKSIESQEMINSEIKKQISLAQGEINLLREGNAQKEFELVDLRETFQRDNQIHKEYISTINKQKKVLEHKNEQLNQLSLSQAEESSKIQKAEKENEFFSVEVERAQSKIEIIEKNLKELVEKRQALASEVEAKEGACKEKTNKIQELDDDLIGENQKIVFLKKSNLEAFGKLEEKESFYKNLRNELSEAISLTCSENEKKEELEKRITILNENIESIRAEISEQEKLKGDIQNEIEVKNENLASFIDENQVLEASVKHLSQEVEEKTILLKEKNNILSDRSKQNLEIKRKQERLEDKKTHLSGKIVEVKRKIEVVSDSLEAYHSSYCKIKDDYIESCRTYESEHAEVNKLNKEIAAVRAQIAEQNQTNRRKKSELSLLKGKLASLRKIHTDAVSFYESQKDESEKLEMGISQLTKDVTALEKSKVHGAGREMSQEKSVDDIFLNAKKQIVKRYNDYLSVDFDIHEKGLIELFIRNYKDICFNLGGLKHLNASHKKVKFWENQGQIFVALVFQKNTQSPIDVEAEVKAYTNRFNKFQVASLKEFDDKVSINFSLNIGSKRKFSGDYRVSPQL